MFGTDVAVLQLPRVLLRADDDQPRLLTETLKHERSIPPAGKHCPTLHRAASRLTRDGSSSINPPVSTLVDECCRRGIALVTACVSARVALCPLVHEINQRVSAPVEQEVGRTAGHAPWWVALVVAAWHGRERDCVRQDRLSARVPDDGRVRDSAKGTEHELGAMARKPLVLPCRTDIRLPCCV